MVAVARHLLARLAVAVAAMRRDRFLADFHQLALAVFFDVAHPELAPHLFLVAFLVIVVFPLVFLLRVLAVLVVRGDGGSGSSHERYNSRNGQDAAETLRPAGEFTRHDDSSSRRATNHRSAYPPAVSQLADETCRGKWRTTGQPAQPLAASGFG